jgi:transposase
VLVTDRYAVHDWVVPERRQVCWAHLLRDVARIGARAGTPGSVGRRLHGLGLLMLR